MGWSRTIISVIIGFLLLGCGGSDEEAERPIDALLGTYTGEFVSVFTVGVNTEVTVIPDATLEITAISDRRVLMDMVEDLELGVSMVLDDGVLVSAAFTLVQGQTTFTIAEYTASDRKLTYHYYHTRNIDHRFVGYKD